MDFHGRTSDIQVSSRRKMCSFNVGLRHGLVEGLGVGSGIHFGPSMEIGIALGPSGSETASASTM